MSTYMYDQKKQTPFKKQIRIRPEQLRYLKSLSGARTLAGKLDIIINEHRAKNEMGPDKPSPRIYTLEEEKTRVEVILRQVFREEPYV